MDVEDEIRQLKDTIGRWRDGGLFAFDAGSQWLPWNIVTVSADYSFEPQVRWVNANGTTTVTLPYAHDRLAGQPLIVKRIGTNTVTIAAQSGDKIDGASTVSLTSQWQARMLVSDGTNWFVGATV